MTRCLLMLSLLVLVIPGCGGGSTAPIPPENPTSNTNEDVNQTTESRTLPIPGQNGENK